MYNQRKHNRSSAVRLPWHLRDRSGKWSLYVGSRATWRASRLMVMITRFPLATLLMVFAFSLSGCRGSMYRTEAGSDVLVSPFPKLKQRTGMVGVVPLPKVLDEMRRAELLDLVPHELQRDYELNVVIAQYDTWWDVIRKVENAFVVVYQPEALTFVRPAATHGIDGPDAAGRATSRDRLALARREHVVMRFRFARGDLAANDDQLGAGGNFVDFKASIPAGVDRTWEVSSFTSGLDRTVVTYRGITGALPGGDFRCNGHLNIQAERSYFEGVRDPGNENPNVVVDTRRQTVPAGVSVPLDIDGPRQRWLQVLEFSTANASLLQSFRGMGLNVGVGVDRIKLWVRVD